jgi:ribonuclease HI
LETYEIIFDGGSLGNPGHGYGSFSIVGPGNYSARCALDFDYLGNAVTNNQAEYLTLITALERLISDAKGRLGEVHVSILGDSQLVVSQVCGTWKVRHVDLQPLHAAVLRRLAMFGGSTVRWHPRARSVEVLGH